MEKRYNYTIVEYYRNGSASVVVCTTGEKAGDDLAECASDMKRGISKAVRLELRRDGQTIYTIRKRN